MKAVVAVTKACLSRLSGGEISSLGGRYLE
jgi:hypothetical protein